MLSSLGQYTRLASHFTPILGGREVSQLLEEPGEVIGILITETLTNGANCHLRCFQQLTRPLNFQPDKVADGGVTGLLPKETREGDRGQIGVVGKVIERITLVETPEHQFDDLLHIRAVMGQRRGKWIVH